ncbi:MAG: ADOP family duplicated permease [Vicinamibacterales bacterium]
MTWLHGLRLRLRALLRRSESEQALREEFEFHLEQETAENVRLGMRPEDARRAAVIAFGGVERHKDDYRDGRSFRRLEETWSDLCQAARGIRRTPRTAVAISLTLGLGLGVAGSVFAVMDKVFFQRPSVRRPADLLLLGGEHVDRADRDGVSWPDFWDLRDAVAPIERMAIFEDAYEAAVVLADGSPAVLLEASIGHGFLEVLGVSPALGRAFTFEEHRDGLPVVMISHALWQARLGGDTAVLTRSLELGGLRRRIVGVLPPGIGYPGGAEFVVPARESPPLPEEDVSAEGFGRNWRPHRAVARIRRGQTPTAAAAALSTASEDLERAHPATNTGYRVVAAPFRTPGTEALQRPVILLQIGVLLILAVAIVNVANLLFARSMRDRHQTAIRLALGAGTGRVVRAGVLESLLFAATGSMVGAVVAVVLVEAAERLSPVPLPPGIGVDWRVMAVMIVAAALAAVAATILPTLWAAAQDPERLVRAGGRTSGTTGGTTRRVVRTQAVLIAMQVALSTVLLLSSGMFLASYARVSRVDPGFHHTKDVVSVRITLQRPKYVPWEGFLRFFREVDHAVAALPGVDASGLSFNNPMEPGRAFMVGFEIPGVIDAPSAAERPTAAIWPVSGGFFETVGLPIIRGRGFAPSDGRDAPGVAIVSDAFVRRYLPGRDPIGLLLEKTQFWGDEYPSRHRIVGVVGDVRADGYAEEPYPVMFLPFEQAPFGNMRLLVRSRLDLAALTDSLRATIWRLDPAIPLDRLSRLEEATAATLTPDRFAAVLTAVLGLVAVMLTGTGLYSVLSYSVAGRMPELGIRIALGASPQRMLREVTASTGRTVLVGWLLGLAGFLAVGRTIASLVFETRTGDPAVLGLGSVVLAVVAGVAAIGPARRAASVPPGQVLRSE